MRIRPATPHDAPAIGEIDPNVRGADLARATLVEDALHGRRDNLCLVVPAREAGARLAGFVVLRHGHFFGRDFVELLFVAPEARRRGVGSALLAAAVAVGIGGRVFTSTNRSNVPMRALLATQGWTISGSLSGLDDADDEIVAWTPGTGTTCREGAAGRPGRLFHVALREDWDRARRAGEYRVSTMGRTLADEGFIHTSFVQQVPRTVQTHYADVDAPLVLLVIERARLGAAVRVEPAPGTDEVFPHVYGPVPVEAVAEAVELKRDATGRRALPVL